MLSENIDSKLADNLDTKSKEKELLKQVASISKAKMGIIRASLGIRPCLSKMELDEIDQSEIDDDGKLILQSIIPVKKEELDNYIHL